MSDTSSNFIAVRGHSSGCLDSEDYSELVLLLVENYNYIDALSGLRIG